MPRAGRYENRVAGVDRPGFAVQGHLAGPAQDEVELLAEQVVMRLRGAACGESGFREALMLDRSIRGVQNTANAGTILRRKRLLIPDIENSHHAFSSYKLSRRMHSFEIGRASCRE